MKSRFNSFFERHEVAWELWMMFLAVAFVATGVAQDSVAHPEILSLLDTIDVSITAFFAIEFVARFSMAPSKAGYFKRHWIDLLALLPAVRFLRLGRLARVLRILRLLPMLRFLASTERIAVHMKGISTQNGLHYVATAMVGLMLASSAAVYLVEAPLNPSIRSYEDALWWSAVTLSTVGYGDVYPMTSLGRLIAVVVMFGGVLLWGMIAASIATYFLSGRKPKNAVLDGLKEQLDRLEEANVEELLSLKIVLTAILDSEIAKGQIGSRAPDPPPARSYFT